MAEAGALEIVTALTTAYSAVEATKKPKLPKVKSIGDPDDPLKKRNVQREMQRKYGSKGRASTVLTGANTLG